MELAFHFGTVIQSNSHNLRRIYFYFRYNYTKLIFSSSEFIMLLTNVSFIMCWFTPPEGDDSDDYNHCETATSCNGLMVTIFEYSIESSQVPFTTKDVLVIGVHHGYALEAIQAWMGATNFTYDIVLNDDITTVVFSNYKMIYIPSDYAMTGGGIECSEVDILQTRTADIATYVNSESGSLMALNQQSCENGWSWLPMSLNFESTNLATLTIQPTLLSIVDTLVDTSLDHCCYHSKFTGPDGYGGLLVLATGDY